MSKSKSARSKPYSTSKRTRHAPLSDQILDEDAVKSTGRQKIRGNRREDDDEYASAQLSKKILLQARKQQEELEEEHGSFSATGTTENRKLAAAASRFSRQDSDSDEDIEEDDEMGSSHFNIEEVDVDEEDEKALERFMPAEAPARRTLADIIQEKLTERKTEMTTAFSDNASLRTGQLDERLVAIYKSVRDILRKYRSGKLPKPFKVIPKLENWEEILYITEPDTWSAAAMYQATRIFVSNLKANMAQRFLNLVLLPRVRDDIEEYKRLNFHLYQALKKGLFKPNAFFKGFLLPLCESGMCTLREATIVASVLAKDSIPMLSSAAAILQIAEMKYNGANSIFLRTLLDKKYALPYRVVDAVVFHFLGFRTEKRALPVLWHQCLLTFVQRYKQDVSSEQREALVELLRLQSHPSITAEIRRELVAAQCRDVELTEPLSDAMELGAARELRGASKSIKMNDNNSDNDSDVDDDDSGEDDESDME